MVEVIFLMSSAGKASSESLSLISKSMSTRTCHHQIADENLCDEVREEEQSEGESGCGWLTEEESGWGWLTEGQSGWGRLTEEESGWCRLTEGQSGWGRLTEEESGWRRLTEGQSGWGEVYIAHAHNIPLASRLLPAIHR